MRQGWERPSLAGYALLFAVLAVGAFMFLKGGGPPDTELTKAVEQTLQAGGAFTATVTFESPSIGRSSRQYEGVTEPGESLEALTDERAVLKNAELIEDVARVGTETLNGVPTTHFSGTVDPELQQEAADARNDELKLPDQYRVELSDVQHQPPEIDAWVDDEGRIQRFQTSETYQDGSLFASTTLDFSY